MILVDTSVWVDHLRVGDGELAMYLDAGRVLGHPMVLGELALGGLQRRATILESLRDLPQAVVASHEEVLTFIETRRLWGRGIGLIDAHLLAATALSQDAKLWTRDRGLQAVADDLGLGMQREAGL